MIMTALLSWDHETGTDCQVYHLPPKSSLIHIHKNHQQFEHYREQKQKQKHLQIIEPEVLNTSTCSDLFTSNTVHSIMVATSGKSTLLDGNSNSNSL